MVVQIQCHPQRGECTAPEKDIHEVIGGDEVRDGTSKRVPGPRSRVDPGADAVPHSWRRGVGLDGIAARGIQPHPYPHHQVGGVVTHPAAQIEKVTDDGVCLSSLVRYAAACYENI